jgi:hypothetical protein
MANGQTTTTETGEATPAIAALLAKHPRLIHKHYFPNGLILIDQRHFNMKELEKLITDPAVKEQFDIALVAKTR